MKYIYIIFKNLVPTSNGTHSAVIRKIQRLMLFREIISVDYHNIWNTNTLCGQNADIFNVKANGTVIVAF